MIGPVAAVENYIFNALNFTGRATRAEYWWIALFQVIAIPVCVGFDVVSVMATSAPSLNPFAYATTIFATLTLVPSLTVTARRLHDTGRSSFWYFIILVPLIGPFWLLFLLARKSEDEDNRWGPIRTAGRRKSGRKDKKDPEKRDPWQGYAVLFDAEREKSPQEIEAEREQINAYYRQRVLGESSTAAS